MCTATAKHTRSSSATSRGLPGCCHEIGLYAGSFDPFQLGHLDIAIRAAGLLDSLFIGVGVNPEKHGGLFAPADRSTWFGKR